MGHIIYKGIMSRKVVVLPANDFKLHWVKKMEKPLILFNSLEDNIGSPVKLLILLLRVQVVVIAFGMSVGPVRSTNMQESVPHRLCD